MAPLTEPPPPERSWLDERVTSVTRGRVQIESGYTYTFDHVHGTTLSQHVLPDLLLRVGLTERLELRVGWPGYLAWQYGAEGSGGEVLNPSLGFMFDLFSQNGMLPQTAVSAAVPIAVDGNPLTMASVQPLCSLLYRWEVSDRLGLEGRTGLGQLRHDGDNYLEFEQIVTIDYACTDRLCPFAEWQMLLDHGSADDGAQHLLSAGLGFAWSDRVQISWRAGVGLNDRAPDFLAGVRLSVRF